MTRTAPAPSLRRAPGAGRVSAVELFFDLVYVFAVTQLSQLLVDHTTVRGAAQAAILLAMVWQVWVYTTWTVNYLDPRRIPVRLLLLLIMLVSLLMSAALPEAFGRHGLLVAVAYMLLQVGRSLAAAIALRRSELRMVFVRVLPWSVVACAVVLAGAFAPAGLRMALWAAAVIFEFAGGAVGFWLPVLGRSGTDEWQVNGSHFAERCQAFVLIALGESVVVIGGLARLDHPSTLDVATFFLAFAGVVAFWWIYFDTSADASSHVIETSSDPGRLARSAFHWVHPLIIGGIIVSAAADEKVLDAPGHVAHAAVAWLVLGGTALFLAGHAVFKAVVWRTVSWQRVGGVVVLALAGLLAPHVDALAVGVIALVVLVAIAVADALVPHGTEHDRTSRADTNEASTTPAGAGSAGTGPAGTEAAAVSPS